ncbi:MAG: hypothetical protein ACRD0P_06675 [Stackebrandtia sp.]
MSDNDTTTPEDDKAASGTETGTPKEPDRKPGGSDDKTTGTDTTKTGTGDGDGPPWDRTGETFDPERAWTLIQNLRAEVASSKKSGKTEPGELVERVSALESQLAAASAAVARERVGRVHGLPDDVVALLGDGDEETLSARAAALIKWADGREDAALPKKRTTPARTRGSFPNEQPDETDPAKLAEQVLARRGQ